jgi:hypothetical protein
VTSQKTKSPGKLADSGARAEPWLGQVLLVSGALSAAEAGEGDAEKRRRCRFRSPRRVEIIDEPPGRYSFDADTVAKVVAVNQQRRVELRFSGAGSELLVVSLPLEEAVAVARLICDYYEQTPFLKHAKRRASAKPK